MKKAVFTAFIMTLFFIPAVCKSTDVQGVLSVNTTWTLGQSPYHVTGNILVSEYIELKIEPGVQVIFKPGSEQFGLFYIRVDGILNAQGTPSQPILFTAQYKTKPWGCIGFTEKSLPWSNFMQKGCILSNCIIEYAGGSQGDGNKFGGAAVKCFSASPMIRSNVIRYSGNDGIVSSIDSTSDNLRGPEIIQNTLYASVGVSGGGVQIVNNLIVGNESSAIHLSIGLIAPPFFDLGGGSGGTFDPWTNEKFDISIMGNTILSLGREYYGSCIRFDLMGLDNRYKVNVTNNFIGNLAGIGSLLVFSDPRSDIDLSNINVSKNNIVKSPGAQFAVVSASLSDQLENNTLLLPDNWWGTTDTAQIDHMIWDYNDDFNLFKVNYLPIAEAPIPNVCIISQYSECSTFDFESLVLHVPFVDLGGFFYFVDLKLVGDRLYLQSVGQAFEASQIAPFDLSTLILHVPCIDLAGSHYWADLRSEGDYLTIADFGGK